MFGNVCMVFGQFLENPRKFVEMSRNCAVARVFASHQCSPGSIPACCHMLVEFLVGSHCEFFSGFSGFPPSTGTNIYNLQFNQIDVMNSANLILKSVEYSTELTAYS